MDTDPAQAKKLDEEKKAENKEERDRQMKNLSSQKVEHQREVVPVALPPPPPPQQESSKKIVELPPPLCEDVKAFDGELHEMISQMSELTMKVRSQRQRARRVLAGKPLDGVFAVENGGLALDTSIDMISDQEAYLHCDRRWSDFSDLMRNDPAVPEPARTSAKEFYLKADDVDALYTTRRWHSKIVFLYLEAPLPESPIMQSPLMKELNLEASKSTTVDPIWAHSAGVEFIAIGCGDRYAFGLARPKLPKLSAVESAKEQQGRETLQTFQSWHLVCADLTSTDVYPIHECERDEETRMRKFEKQMPKWKRVEGFRIDRGEPVAAAAGGTRVAVAIRTPNRYEGIITVMCVELANAGQPEDIGKEPGTLLPHSPIRKFGVGRDQTDIVEVTSIGVSSECVAMACEVAPENAAARTAALKEKRKEQHSKVDIKDLAAKDMQQTILVIMPVFDEHNRTFKIDPSKLGEGIGIAKRPPLDKFSVQECLLSGISCLDFAKYRPRILYVGIRSGYSMRIVIPSPHEVTKTHTVGDVKKQRKCTPEEYQLECPDIIVKNCRVECFCMSDATKDKEVEYDAQLRIQDPTRPAIKFHAPTMQPPLRIQCITENEGGPEEKQLDEDKEYGIDTYKRRKLFQSTMTNWAVFDQNESLETAQHEAGVSTARVRYYGDRELTAVSTSCVCDVYVTHHADNDVSFGQLTTKRINTMLRSAHTTALLDEISKAAPVVPMYKSTWGSLGRFAVLWPQGAIGFFEPMYDYLKKNIPPPKPTPMVEAPPAPSQPTNKTVDGAV
jgi:hypothetical protein